MILTGCLKSCLDVFLHVLYMIFEYVLNIFLKYFM